MSGTNDELGVARDALVKARDDLLRQLASEPAWRALRQLDWREAGQGTSAAAGIAAARADLHARLDASVPKWRTLADIDAAISALASRTPVTPRPRGKLPPPPPVALRDPSSDVNVPHVRIEPERTRFASQTRPAAVVPRPEIAAPVNSRQALRRVEPRPATQSRRNTSAGGRLAAALGLGGEGPARLSAIESEVERLMRRDVGTWEGAPVAPAPSRPPVRSPVDAIAAPFTDGDEAEVEIVMLAPVSPREERRPITKLADRLSRVPDSDPHGGKVESVISMHAHREEASVEIEVPSPVVQGPLLLTHDDGSKS